MRLSSNANALISAVVVAAVLLAITVMPGAVAAGVAVNRGYQIMESTTQEIATKPAPEMSVMTDRNGSVIGTFYTQRRRSVESSQISDVMKKAIVAIEDRRFYEHHGLDIRGTLRAVVANLTAGGVSEGASTLNQQYVKNYLMLVSATTDEERAAAKEETLARKLREMKLAADLDKKFTKDEILTRYLNLVDFGNSAYGIEEAAKTYFNTSAKDLTLAQSAMLAGIVQSPSNYNPYSNPEGTTERRNQVLDAMASTGDITEAQAQAAKAEGLGVGSSPNVETNGCIGSGEAGFFCDYALTYLANHGISRDAFSSGGYTLKTTLDPDAQSKVDAALAANVSPTQPGVAETMSLINPAASDGHEIVAVGSSRVYGLDDSNSETVLPLATSSVGNGAGSVFKVFAAAAAIEKGMGLNTVMNVPSQINVSGMGTGGVSGCPAGMYCVRNAGNYPSKMTLQDALAQSPNTPFIDLEKRLGVSTVVDYAVKMGLRSLDSDTTSDGISVAQNAKDTNMGSFILGPVAVNTLELSNVAATIADNGRWCEPLPVKSLTKADGSEEKDLQKPSCEQVLDEGAAHALANGLSQDAVKGTAAASAKATGWSGALAAKTGTTETSQSSAFLAFTSGLAGAVYAFNDGGSSSPLCTSPLRQCASGNLYGGNEPARTFFAGAKGVVANYGGTSLPSMDDKYRSGTDPKALGYS